METNGIHGKAHYTPGHTSGSMSILLDSGEAFVGDIRCAHRARPQRFLEGQCLFPVDNLAR